MNKLTNNIYANIACLFVIFFVLEAGPVPSGNESLYLSALVKQWNPDYLLNDWTLSGPQFDKMVFNAVFGSLSLFLPLEMFGWICRISCWILLLIALYRIGKHFKIPIWMITLSILLWQLNGQSLVGGEWMIRGFEAKTVAYVLLLFSLSGFLENNTILPSIFLGLSFSFHPSVGMWGILAAVPAMIVSRYRVRTLLQVIGLVSLGCLPGLIPLLIWIFQGVGLSESELRYLSLVAAPWHLDPASWIKRDILWLYVLFLFNWMHYRTVREDESIRFLFFFQTLLCVVFSLGLMARITENYGFLKFLPFRLFPLFTLLFFFWHLMSAYCQRAQVKQTAGFVIVGFVAILSLQDPVGALVDQARNNYRSWTKKDHAYEAFEWIAENTQNGDIVILPPWYNKSFYLAQRAQIAQWGQMRTDRVGEYRDRIESLIGEIRDMDAGGALSQYNRHFYFTLTEEDIADIVMKFNAAYLVTKGDYEYPMLFESGTYKVYAVN